MVFVKGCDIELWIRHAVVFIQVIKRGIIESEANDVPNTGHILQITEIFYNYKLYHLSVLSMK